MRTIRHFPYNRLGLSDEDNSVSRTDNFVNVNVFSSVTSARVLSCRWVLHYFSTIPVGRTKIVTESDSLSSRVFYSAVSTAPRFLLVEV